MAVHALKSNMRRAQPYTWATLPAAGLAGRNAWCSNFGTGGSLLVDTGTRWKPVGTVTLASLDTAVTLIPNTETIAFQYQIPTAMWTIKDRLRISYTLTKSGAVDTGAVFIRVGTAGTVGDTNIYSGNIAVAGTRAFGVLTDFRLESATTIQTLGASGNTPGYSIAGAGASTAAVTVTSAAANSLFFNVSIKSNGATDTVGLSDAVLQYISGAN